MKRPINREANLERGTVILYFKDDDPREFYMRGAVCWPISFIRNGAVDVNGFILMAGMDVQTGVVQVFEQRDFVVVESIIGKDYKVEFEGVSRWFNGIWSRYFARDYYWHHEVEQARKYRLEVIRSMVIDPKPQFIEVPWTDSTDADHLIWMLVKTGKLKFESGSQVHRELEIAKEAEKETIPAMHALRCLVMGLGRYPWKEKYPC